MSFLLNNQVACPRLADYIVIVGSKHRNVQKQQPQQQYHTPQLLRRYPPVNHSDFELPVDVVSFCQPDGCLTNSNKRLCQQETTSFVFTLTEKDSGIVRFGICLNFYRPVENQFNSDMVTMTGGNADKMRTGIRPTKKSGRYSNVAHTLTSLCIISHYSFFSKFRQCLYILKNIIEKSNGRICKSIDNGSSADRNKYDCSIWSVLLGLTLHSSLPPHSQVLAQVCEIESWILRLLSAPSPKPGERCLYLTVLPETVQDPLIFALPDKTRLSLVDFPLHLPLELLGIDTCLKVLTAIILEQKVVVQSRDYNALTMAVMAFTALLYPLQYMFPVIPLLPTSMNGAEQLLLAPTPYLIGLPASFLQLKNNFQLPPDVWLIDLDSNKLISSANTEPLPGLPEPERTELVMHLQQAMASIHSAPPINNLDQFDDSGLILPPGPPDSQGNPGNMSSSSQPLFIFGNDVDSVDVATRVAMVKFFNSPNLLANFTEHTRTLRLYPRPVVMFQYLSFLKSRQAKTQFTVRLARTQAVEYLAEWSLCPENEVFQRIHSGLYDPSIIGDKAKWYSPSLVRQDFLVCRPGNACTLHVNWSSNSGGNGGSNNGKFDNDSDDGAVNSDMENSSAEEEQMEVYNSGTISSYSSYSDFHDSGVSVGTIRDEASQISEIDKLSVRLEDVYMAPLTESKSKDELSIISSSGDEDVEEGSSSDQKPSNRPAHPMRPPPPTKVGSIGSHPGTPIGAPKTADSDDKPNQQYFFPDGQLSKDESQKPSTNSTVNNAVSPEYDARSNRSSDSEITGLELLKDLGEQMTGAASHAGHTINDMLGAKGISVSKLTKPYSHLGPKKSLIERSFLSQQVHNSLARNNQSNIPGTLESKRLQEKKNQKLQLMEQLKNNAQSTENQLYLKEIVANVLKGTTPSVFNRSRVAKLLEDENYRNFILSKLYVCLERKISENQPHVEDVCIGSKSVFKAIQWLLGVIIQGLEVACKNRGSLGGMASAFLLLEILNTHYLCVVPNNHGQQSSQASTPDGSTNPNQMMVVARQNHTGSGLVDDDGGTGKLVNTVDAEQSLQQPAMVPVRQPHYGPSPEHHTAPNINSQSEPSGPEDAANSELLRSLVLSKDESATGPAGGLARRMMSIESTDSLCTSSVISNSRITHEAIRPSSLAPTATPTVPQKEAALFCTEDKECTVADIPLYPKCRWSGRYRYRCSKLVPLEKPTASQGDRTMGPRTYLFEVFVNDLEKLRHSVWANLQFWEDVFLDTVAQERDMVGMDQGTVEMMKRYAGLSRAERRRLQLDEDRLLATLLFNLTAFMLMMRMDVGDVRNKIRRVLASCHLGLHYSQQISRLLDNLHLLQANDIDLKPLVSRLMQRKSFTVHWGTEPTGDILFFEVFDDCIIIRSISGAIMYRWWFEKIIHFSFCPRTKVVVFWMKSGAKIDHNKLYTKKCKELYNCVKDTLEKAASRSIDTSQPPPEMGGEFPIRNRSTNEPGTIQVCMDGLSIDFPTNQHHYFIPISHVRRCLTHRGDTFIIEMIDPNSKKIKMKKYFSDQASNITYSVLCLFSYLAASLNNNNSITPSPSFSTSNLIGAQLDQSNVVGSNQSQAIHNSYSSNSLT